MIVLTFSEENGGGIDGDRRAWGKGLGGGGGRGNCDLSGKNNVIKRKAYLFMTFILIASNVWFYPMSLWCPASGSWPSRRYHRWAPSHDVALKLDQSLIGYSPNFCFTFTLAHLVGKANCFKDE